MKIEKKYIALIVALTIVAIIVGYFLSESSKEKYTIEKQLTLALSQQETKTPTGKKITLSISIKNDNLDIYKKTYESPCEELWTIEWEKDGKPIDKKIKDCKKTTTKHITFKPAESKTVIINKELTEPGKYKVTVNVFGQKLSKEITVGKKD